MYSSVIVSALSRSIRPGYSPRTSLLIEAVAAAVRSSGDVTLLWVVVRLGTKIEWRYLCVPTTRPLRLERSQFFFLWCLAATTVWDKLFRYPFGLWLFLIDTRYCGCLSTKRPCSSCSEMRTSTSKSMSRTVRRGVVVKPSGSRSPPTWQVTGRPVCNVQRHCQHA